jgi:hypothetical protein
MRINTTLLVLAVSAGLLAGPRAVEAQERTFEGLAAGTVTFPLSGSADYFNPGIGGTIGAIWNLGDQYGVRVDGTWSTLSPRTVDVSTVGQNLDLGAQIQYLTASFFFQGEPGRVRPYVIGGLGVYRRAVSISGGGSNLVSVCVPWWFACEASPVPATRVAGTHATIDLGLTVGLGVNVGRYFGEIRYHYATGPQIATPGDDTRASGKFIPLTIGVRF